MGRRRLVTLWPAGSVVQKTGVLETAGRAGCGECTHNRCHSVKGGIALALCRQFALVILFVVAPTFLPTPIGRLWITCNRQKHT